MAWGLLKPMRGQTYDLDNYDTIILKFVAGDSDSPDRYPVALRVNNAATEMELFNSSDYGKSREQADLLREFLDLPLQDITTDHPEVIEPEAETTALPNQQVEVDMSDVPVPAELKTDIQNVGNGVQISIPGPAFSLSHILSVLIPWAILLYFGQSFFGFFRHTQTPVFVQMFFGGFGLLFFFFIPLIAVIKRFLAARTYTVIVTVSSKGIEIRPNGDGHKKTVILPKERILSIDYSTVQTSFQAALSGNSTPNYAYGNPVQINSNTGFAPFWVRVLAKVSRSKGIFIKSRSGIYSFGAGLPDDEIYYLYTLVKQHLM
jgi:hypothetical protein